jgi:hypothetical protein
MKIFLNPFLHRKDPHIWGTLLSYTNWPNIGIFDF